jgi:hypothetical protein
MEPVGRHPPRRGWLRRGIWGTPPHGFAPRRSRGAPGASPMCARPAFVFTAMTKPLEGGARCPQRALSTVVVTSASWGQAAPPLMQGTPKGPWIDSPLKVEMATSGRRSATSAVATRPEVAFHLEPIAGIRLREPTYPPADCVGTMATNRTKSASRTRRGTSSVRTGMDSTKRRGGRRTSTTSSRKRSASATKSTRRSAGSRSTGTGRGRGRTTRTTRRSRSAASAR